MGASTRSLTLAGVAALAIASPAGADQLLERSTPYRAAGEPASDQYSSPPVAGTAANSGSNAGGQAGGGGTPPGATGRRGSKSGVAGARGGRRSAKGARGGDDAPIRVAASAGRQPAQAAPDRSLPFTGGPLGTVVFAGLLLLAAGGLLRAAQRRRA